MFQSVREKLVDDQAQGYGSVDVQSDVPGINGQTHLAGRFPKNGQEVGTHVLEVSFQGDAGKIVRLVELFVDQGH